MPIYEYVCACCGEKFELLRRFSDEDSDVKCANCGKTDAKRMVSAFSTTASTGDCVPSSGTGST